MFYISANQTISRIKYLISIFSWMWGMGNNIEHGLQPCMLSFISNVFFKYAPKWMISCLIFQKKSRKGRRRRLIDPLPHTPSPFFLGLRHRFGFRPQFFGASRLRQGFSLYSRAVRALVSGFALNFLLENLVCSTNRLMDPPLIDHFDFLLFC